MPFVAKPVCASCKATTSNLWRKGSNGNVYCNNCPKKESGGTDDAGSVDGNGSQSRDADWTFPTAHAAKVAASQLTGPLRKSARIKPSKYKYQPIMKTQMTKGKSRRAIFKKNPIKAPAAVSTVVTSEYIFYEGQYWQVGDIVSVMDHDGGVYYAQIRGFLQDQYCEKSAVITWLLPTLMSPPDRFDPATYIIGPEEDLPRPMCCFELEMHAPSSYFHDKNTPYSTKAEGPELGFIWTHIGPEIRRVPPNEQMFGLQELDSDDIPPTAMDKAKAKQESDRKRKIAGNLRRKAKNGKGGVPVALKEKVTAKDNKVVIKEKPIVPKEKVNQVATPKEILTVVKLDSGRPSRRESKSFKIEKETKPAISKMTPKEKVVAMAEVRSRRNRRKTKKMELSSS